LLGPSGSKVIDALASGLGEILPTVLDRERAKTGAQQRAIVEQVEVLQARLDAVEQKTISYRGVWSAATNHARNDLVTLAGSGWIATSEPSARPGSPGSGWTLAVKRAG
jgi:hypothetical protein